MSADFQSLIESAPAFVYSGAMTISASLIRGALVLLLSLALGGCLPATQSQSDEEKEPHFLTGKSRVNAMDYKGAIESFEKALEVNPQSASAHFELGWLFDQKEPDPAAAIYHYDCYLRLRPNAANGETVVKPRILACKQELARTVSLGPVTQTLQREFERLTEENKRLTDETNRLHDEVEKWRAFYAARPPGVQTNSPVAPSGSAGVRNVSTGSLATLGTLPTNSAFPGRLAGSAPGSGSGRTHTVKVGETLNMIARENGMRLETLLAANPHLNPRRMQVGMIVNLPTQ
jgi:tetratricopeptide (TPR) repeat protein